MTYSTALQDVPILLIDVADFISKYKGVGRQRALLRHLQTILTESARFFMPYGDVWAKWRRHGAGDGYYFLFDAMPPQVALNYALELTEGLNRFNDEHADLKIRLRQVLAFGDVEWVDDQILSEAFAVAERLISFGPFKEYSAGLQEPASLATSDLFHLELKHDLANEAQISGLTELSWSSFEAVDKHGERHSGYALGDGWDQPVPLTPEAAERLKVTILIGHSVEDPIPEAVEMAKLAVRNFEGSGLHVEVRVDQASVSSLRREAKRGCHLLIYYGHGSDGGHLAFVDGRKAFTHLGEDAGLGNFWQKLPVCFLFACHGDRFAQHLPGPWVAFSKPILTNAPKGFMQAFIPALACRGLAEAVKEARELCDEEMRSDFSDAMQFSSAPLPNLPTVAGEPVLSRLSPALANRTRLDFASIQDGDRRYPDHDPFVGREADLKRLLRLPSPYDDRPQQRVLWVHGDAGMGKSALLRQFAVHVRDLVFHEVDEPIYLLHLHCFGFTRIEDVASELCRRARELYDFDATPDTPESLALQLEFSLGTRGTHVWVLDDLTYLSTAPDSSEQAGRLVQSLRDSARSHALRWQLVVSSRRGGPTPREALGVGSLTQVDALKLAERIRRSGPATAGDPQEWASGAAQLFGIVQGGTAQYKRSLQLALERGMSLRAYADELREAGGLEALGLTELAQKMVEYEIAQLGQLEERHGFAYRRFLAKYYPLIARAGWFSGNELKEWFGDQLASPTHSLDVAYRNGLNYLLRLNFLLVQRRDGSEVFTMPPNQRWSMMALWDSERALPGGVPLRGARERLSLALEREKLGDPVAVGELLSMEQDYRNDLDNPSAAAAVFHGMMVRAKLAGGEEELTLLEAIVDLYDANRGFYPPDETEAAAAVALALLRKGIRLGALDRSDEELKVYDVLTTLFGDREGVRIAEQVSEALFKKAIRLRALDRIEEELDVYDLVISQYGERDELPIARQNARALLNKGFRLGKLGRIDEELEIYDLMLERYGDREEVPIAEPVAMALAGKNCRLGALGRREEAHEVLRLMLERYGDRDEGPIVESEAKALFNECLRLSALGRSEEALKAYELLLGRYSGWG